MPKERIVIDKKEIVVDYMSGKNYAFENLAGEDISSVTIEPCMVGFFKNKPDERIVITKCVPSEPIIYYRHKIKKDYDSYVEGLKKFCEENNVKFFRKT